MLLVLALVCVEPEVFNVWPEDTESVMKALVTNLTRGHLTGVLISDESVPGGRVLSTPDPKVGDSQSQVTRCSEMVPNVEHCIHRRVQVRG